MAMRLPVLDPRDLVSVVPRLFALLGDVEALVRRTGRILDDVERVTGDAAGVVSRTDAVVGRAEEHVHRVVPLIDGLEPSLTRLQPVLERLAETTDPGEVEALVRMVDHLPELTRRLERDVLPVLGTLGSVAPDLHDLLAVSRELNDMLAKVPGLGRIKKRIDEQQGQDDTDQPVTE